MLASACSAGSIPALSAFAGCELSLRSWRSQRVDRGCSFLFLLLAVDRIVIAGDQFPLTSPPIITPPLPTALAPAPWAIAPSPVSVALKESPAASSNLLNSVAKDSSSVMAFFNCWRKAACVSASSGALSTSSSASCAAGWLRTCS